MKVFFLHILCLILLQTSYLLASSDSSPNILIIFADDLGYETVGAYGGLDFETPQLDRMAGEGIRFSRAYTSPVCTPSRVSLQTGLYTVDHKQTNVLPVHRGSKEEVDFSSMPTFASLFRDNGYATSVTGKWQLAALDYHPDHPWRTGFDSWCVWQIWDAKNDLKTTRYWNPTLNRDGVVLNGQTLQAPMTLPNHQQINEDITVFDARDSFGPDTLHAYVKEKMAKSVESRKPFLILHNMMLPHAPLVATPDDVKPSLKGMVRYMDKLVGELLDEVDRLGIRENTYVFFIGDNGTDVDTARRTRDGFVQGGKRDLVDTGSHVPFIVWGPETIEKGSVNRQLVDITDVYPTICELADIDIPDTTFLRGYSIAGEILGTGESSPREWSHMGIGNANVLYDGRWRYIRDGKEERLIDYVEFPEGREGVNSPEAEAALIHLRSVMDGLVGGKTSN